MVIDGKKFVEVNVLAQVLHIPSIGALTMKDHWLAALSPVEQQVTELIIHGKSRADIAIAVNRTPRTVSDIQKRLLKKTGSS